MPEPASTAPPLPSQPEAPEPAALPKARSAGAAVKGVTPSMAQYFSIKEQYGDYLLFFRMGDFYELFFEDAVAAARCLDIRLTKRGLHQGEPIPMCGVPVHAAVSYLEKLIRAGFRVAICEQMEDPAEAKKRGSKAVVRREVVRLVTPGTLTDEALLEPREANYLAAVFLSGEGASADPGGLAWLDMSTGDFRTAPLPAGAVGGTLENEIARLAPKELLVPEPVEARVRGLEAVQRLKVAVTPLSAGSFSGTRGRERLAERFEVLGLEGFGTFTGGELSAAGALLDYVDLTQQGAQAFLRPPQRQAAEGVLALDGGARANLELTRCLNGDRQGSLFWAIDRTVTVAGARALKARLEAPSTSAQTIEGWLETVAALVANNRLRGKLRQDMAGLPDLSRALGRLLVGRGGPRDLKHLSQTVLGALACGAHLTAGAGKLTSAPAPLTALRSLLDRPETPEALLAQRLAAALEEEPPSLAREGKFIRVGFDEALDDLRRLSEESRSVLAELEARYRDETGISALKIKHNSVWGYFIEVSALHGETLRAAPFDKQFHHRQSLANAVRFTTEALSALAEKIDNAQSLASERERALFAAFEAEVSGLSLGLAALADGLAELDLYTALGTLAAERGYVRPSVNDSRRFLVEGGRHPVVEAVLARDGGSFIANDCRLDGEGGAPLAPGEPDDQGDRLWLLTGPNMAGKSTFLRQNALLVILAQIGSFVPAVSAEIGVVDKLFSRVGAADDLARGRSTFMVEMVETAAILNQATARSFVILDEIGRGTATYDGMSIAWAAIEHLHNTNRCRALFATHYHELTALEDHLPGLANRSMRVREWKAEVVFMHEVIEGAADRSYGIHVGKLAGLPEPVIRRAQEVMAQLEVAGRRFAVVKGPDDLPLFQAAGPPGESPNAATPAPHPASHADLLEELQGLDVDALSPREALEILYRLKQRIDA